MIRRPLRALSHARQRAGHYVFQGFFEGLSRVGRMHPDAAPRRHGVEVIRDLPYRDTGSKYHTLDVYRPVDRPGPLPVMLYVHGGGFMILSKDTHWIMGIGFAKAQFVVFNINYRLAPRHRFPKGLEDVCAALRWVLDHAHEYGGDVSRLVYAGESAGGNLVTALAVAGCYERPEPWARAVFDADPRPAAVLPACALLQVSDTERFARRRKMSKFLDDRLTDVTLAYLPRGDHGVDLTLADPLVLFEKGTPPDRPLPPFFALVGTKDPLLDDTRRLKRALNAMGVECEARFYQGGLHAFHAVVVQEQARQAWRDQYRFLRKHVRR